MKDKISRILLAIDGSESSMTAAEYAFSITAHYHAADLIVLHVLPIGIKREYFEYNPQDIPAWIRENLLEYKHEVEGWFDRIKEKYQKQKGEQKQKQQQEIETANINLKTDMVDLMTSVAGTIVGYAEEEGWYKRNVRN